MKGAYYTAKGFILHNVDKTGPEVFMVLDTMQSRTADNKPDNQNNWNSHVIQNS